MLGLRSLEFATVVMLLSLTNHLALPTSEAGLVLLFLSILPLND